MNDFEAVASRSRAMARGDAEHAAVVARLSRLQAITSALSSARTPSDVVRVALGEGMAAVGAAAASAAVVDASGDHLEVVGAIGLRPEVVHRFRRFPVDADLPIAQAVRLRQSQWRRSREELRAAHPNLEGLVDPNNRAWAAVPLLVEDRVLGAIGLCFPEPRSFDPAEQAFLEAIGAQCAQALERARLYDAEASARAAAEEARNRLEFLAEASSALNSTLDMRSVLDRFAELAVPRLGDCCVVHLLDANGEPRVIKTTSIHADQVARVDELLEGHPARVGVTEGVRRVLSTGRSVLYPQIGDRSGMVVPLTARGRLLGTVALLNERGRAATQSDLTLAEGLAARAAAAIDNARLFEERSHVARSLQASLLPPLLPQLPGLELGARYVAAGAGAEVGGDFYDAFAVSRDRWLLVVGDVCGRGADAAGVTGLARHVLRAAAIEHSRPSDMLRNLNDVLLRAQGELSAEPSAPRFCTACVATVTPGAGGAELTVCCAGHPLPLIRRSDGGVEEAGKPGSLIGVLNDPDLVDVTVELHPGDAFVCFTDGVTERRQGGEYFEDRLAGVVADGAARGAEAIAEQIQRAAQAFGSAQAGDDMAILVLAAPPQAIAESTLDRARLDLEGDVAAPAAARSFAEQTLAGWGMAGGLASDAILAVSELVTNSVLHADSNIVVELERRDEAVRIIVSDEAASLPVLRHYSAEALTGRGLEVIGATAWQWAVDELPTGKRVWADIRVDGRAPAAATGDRLPSPQSAESAAGSPEDAGDGFRRVVFPQVPVAVYLQLMEHNDSVLREFELLGIRATGGKAPSAPQRLMESVTRAIGGFRQQRDGFREAVEAAAARGEELVDLEAHHPPDAPERAAAYVDLLEEADEYCREQGLCGPASPAVAALRRWFADETAAQMIDGRAPEPPAL